MNTFELFQEAVPFSNKRHDYKVSTDTDFTNPVVMPFAFDFTTPQYVMESVIYLRNNSNEYRYENVVVSLCKEDSTLNGGGDPALSHADIVTTSGDSTLDLNGFSVPISLSTETPLADGTINLVSNDAEQNGYYDNYAIIDGTDDTVDVKFSYGYDELTVVDWDNQSSVLVIPNIGTTGQPDISYHAIRMRITWKKKTEIFTVRDYFMNVSYTLQSPIGV